MGPNVEQFPVGHRGAGTGCQALVCPRTSWDPEQWGSIEEATMATQELYFWALSSNQEGSTELGAAGPKSPIQEGGDP